MDSEGARSHHVKVQLSLPRGRHACQINDVYQAIKIFSMLSWSFDQVLVAFPYELHFERFEI